MAQTPYNLRAVGLAVAVTVVLFLAYAPHPLLDLAHNLLALWSFVLLIVALGTLIWFFYWFFLRRLIRARRIANLRLKRLMEERDEDHSHL